MSVVFGFNASLNDVAPVSPMSLSVDLLRMEKSDLLMDAICVICVLFLLYSLLRLSFVSVFSVFSTSLKDVAPVSPIVFPVHLMRVDYL